MSLPIIEAVLSTDKIKEKEILIAHSELQAIIGARQKVETMINWVK